MFMKLFNKKKPEFRRDNTIFIELAILPKKTYIISVSVADKFISHFLKTVNVQIQLSGCFNICNCKETYVSKIFSQYALTKTIPAVCCT